MIKGDDGHDRLCPAEREWDDSSCACMLIQAVEERDAKTAEKVGLSYAWRSSERDMVKRIAKEIRGPR